MPIQKIWSSWSSEEFDYLGRLSWPGQKLGKLGNLGKLGSFFLRFLNLSFRFCPTAKIRKLRIIFPRFQRFPRFASFWFATFSFCFLIFFSLFRNAFSGSLFYICNYSSTLYKYSSFISLTKYHFTCLCFDL